MENNISEMKNSLVVCINSKNWNSHQMFTSETIKYYMFYKDLLKIERKYLCMYTFIFIIIFNYHRYYTRAKVHF